VAIKKGKMSTLKTAIGLLSKGDFHEIRKRIQKKILKDKFRDSDFRQLVDEKEIKPKFEEALLYLKKFYQHSKPLGDYLEFGVSHGSSILYMFETTKKLRLDTIRLFGFDSFEGLPEEALTEDGGNWKPGDFYAKERKVRRFLAKSGIEWDRVKLVKGWFKDTLLYSFIEQNKIEKASIIMIDCDLYSAAKEALTFCVPLIVDKTIIFFDDWNAANLASRNLGEKKAFDEFLIENPQFEAEEFGNYSCHGKQNGMIMLVSLKNTKISK
jgi:hypothetical protein